MRTLVVHQAEGFTERSLSLSVNYDPSPATPLGLTARLAPAWGGETGSSAQALWASDNIGAMGGRRLAGAGNGRRLDTEVGYGLPDGRRFIGTPRLGLRTSEHGQDYRIGYSMRALKQAQLRLQLGVEMERRVSPVFGLGHEIGGSWTDQRVLGQASVEW